MSPAQPNFLRAFMKNKKQVFPLSEEILLASLSANLRVFPEEDEECVKKNVKFIFYTIAKDKKTWYDSPP